MAEPISVATAVGWGMKVVGWVVSPAISSMVKEAYSILKIDPGDKLDLLAVKIVQLELMLTCGEAEVLRQKETLGPLLEKLKSAYYEAEEFLDLLDYNRLEKQALSLSNDKSKMVTNIQNWLTKQGSGFKSNDVPPGLSKKKLKKILGKIEHIVNAAHSVMEFLNLPRTSLDNMPPSSDNLRTMGIPNSKVIGRDTEIDNIVARLHDQEGSVRATSHYSVVGIHGIAGSGKTTLAQAIFAREKRAHHFDKCIWIHVSQNFDLDSICRDLIQAVSVTGPAHVNLTEFDEILNEQLHEQRYLLILDDVWFQPRDAKCSEKLLRILPPRTAGKMGSKVVVTSRSSEAALVLGAAKHNCIAIQDLDGLSFNALFMHHALGDSCLDESELSEFQECGVRIAKKLRRSPLLAKTVGGQLYRNHSMDFWRRAENKNLIDDLLGALWWSYLQLPVLVRRCFAFCGVFPRRWPINRGELIQMWIAAGFIRGTTEEDLESVANDCFEHLISVSFFQPAFGGEAFFAMHDLIHDLAIKVSGNDVFTVQHGWEGKIPQNCRHLFVHSRGLDMVEIVKPLKVLRTLILHSDEMELNEKMFSALPKLRIFSIYIGGVLKFPLILASPSICMIIPESIVTSKHLRYLSVSGDLDRNYEVHLPKKLAKAYHLELLKLTVGMRHSVLFNFGEENVCYTNLRHLISLGPLDVPYIGRARSLQTLNYFAVKNGEGFQIKQLHDLNNLRGRMQISGLEHIGSSEEAIQANLSCKIHLKHLVLEWNPRWAVHADIDITTKVLYSLCPPPDLERLEVINYCGLPYPQWLVDKQTCLRGLRELSFYNSSHLGAGPDLASLVNLKTILIELCCWDTLPTGMCSLAKLTFLTISGCPNIKELPELPNSLIHLNLWLSNPVLMDSCKVGQPNWEKIEHIPHKNIGRGPDWAKLNLRSVRI